MTESKAIKWRKIGGGSLRWNGKIIKPNEIFRARPEEVPLSFRKYLVALEDVPKPPDIVPVKTFTAHREPVAQKEVTAAQKEVPAAQKEVSIVEKEIKYELGKRGTGVGGWWNVVNMVSGKPINDKGLRESAAKQLAQELNL